MPYYLSHLKHSSKTKVIINDFAHFKFTENNCEEALKIQRETFTSIKRRSYISHIYFSQSHLLKTQ